MSLSEKYRTDIDGLRAVAVVPVVLYHAGVSVFSGGYVGVDVFFVISGFLITSLILPEVAESRFSFRSFYERRIRRLFPAMFALGLYLMPWKEEAASDIDRPPRLLQLSPKLGSAEAAESRAMLHDSISAFRHAQHQVAFSGEASNSSTLACRTL